MTEPARVGELLPEVLQEVIARAGPGYARWAEQVAATGYCAHPVRLRGRVEHADQATGELREVYTTDREPDAALLKACGNRRASVCPSCSATYQADSFQLLAAGLRGGKGLPDSVAGHPRLFVTFTAPSFGRVHSRRARGRLVLPCHPTGKARAARTAAAPAAGTATTRTTLAWGSRCALGATRPGRRCSGMPWRGGCGHGPPSTCIAPWPSSSASRKGSYAGWCGSRSPRWPSTSAGARSTSTIIRLDAATACRCPACLLPPPPGFTATVLEAAVRHAAASVTVPCPGLDDHQGVTLTAGWGEQLDVRHIHGADAGGELSAEQVAGYVAKYATKSTEALGVTLNRRVTANDLDGLELPAHVAELVRACWELGARPSLVGLRLRAWAHMLGFGGHFASKSRRYSTTLGALRRARVAYAIRRRRGGNAVPLDAWGQPEDDQAAVVIATWRYVGSGYQSTGEAWLAALAAARAREERHIAREELTTTTLTAA